jgi:hypothetical protein
LQNLVADLPTNIKNRLISGVHIFATEYVDGIPHSGAQLDSPYPDRRLQVHRVKEIMSMACFSISFAAVPTPHAFLLAPARSQTG